jgi:hypothetical protein
MSTENPDRGPGMSPDLLGSFDADSIEEGCMRRSIDQPGHGPLCDDACMDEATAAGTCRHTDGYESRPF